MIEIYDEMGHIKNVLEHGLDSANWERDGRLLARYYRDEGVKKAEVKKIVKEKCERYGGDNYDKNSSFKRINKFVDQIFKKDSDGTYKDKIREIKEIVITKDVVDWFLGLEKNFVLTDEQVEIEKKRRPKVSVKKNPMNFNRIKYLFTLFIWTKVQENYLERPNIHYLKAYSTRFKEDADLKKSSFNMTNERNFLYDLGFIDINHGLGIITTFMDKYDVFKIPVTEKNKVIIKGDDMYYCGYWLLKQKMGSFVCQRCGKEFAHYNFSPQEKKRKYCKECSAMVFHEVDIREPQKYTLQCVDCKKIKNVELKECPEVFVCEDCKKKRREAMNRDRVKKYRDKKDVILNPVLTPSSED